MVPWDAVTHGLVVVALLVCYTVLTATGHDGTALWGALAGYLGGAGVQKVAAPTKAP